MSKHGNSKFTGDKNSQHGSFWITDGVINRKLRKDTDTIPEGWKRGRTIKKEHIKKSKDNLICGLRERGVKIRKDFPFNICSICGNSTNSHTRKTCSTECYHSILRKKSRANPKCGGQKHTNREEIFNLLGECYIAESSYEVNLSILLNDMNIMWNRPSFFLYSDKDGNDRRYYPDFFLPEYDLYIDPKNDYLISTDIDKIIRVAKQNSVTIIILGKNYISIDGIKEMVALVGNAPTHPPCKRGALLLS